MSDGTQDCPKCQGSGIANLPPAAPAAAPPPSPSSPVGSPGVLSGNLVQVPVHVPVNILGNTINVIGVLNPTFNQCPDCGGTGKVAVPG